MDLAVIILAAGEGTRMKSKLPKVLHQVAGKPMLCHVVETAQSLSPKRLIVIVSPNNLEPIKDHLEEKVEYAQQKEQLGTAHAVKQASSILKDFNGNVLVLYADTPLIKEDSLKDLVAFHDQSDAKTTIITSTLADPTGYGRIIRSNDEDIVRIVEEKDANDEEKMIQEVNSGMYCFDSQELFEKLELVKAENEQKEYYLTDVIGMLVRERSLVESFEVEQDQILGVNSRYELAHANFLMYQDTNSHWLDNQVTIVDPLSTYIEKEVKIETGCIIHPNTFIKGNSKLGNSTEVGPNTQITNSEIANDCKVAFSVLDGAKVGPNSVVGPFTHLRAGTAIEGNGKVGAFSEVKNSHIGIGSKVPHLSYIGDSQIAENVNIGAGTITCNYDGRRKHKTIIKKGAFIGSSTMFVAPVTIGQNAVTGAGSVIAHDVPDEALAIERTEQKNIPNYSSKIKRKSKKEETQSKN